jgi:hypothetical protein
MVSALGYKFIARATAHQRPSLVRYNGRGETKAHCHVYHAVHYSSVSKASLQKTGVLLNSAGDFREFSPKKFENGATGDFQQLEKPAIGGPFYY